MTCQMMLYIMYMGEVFTAAKYIESNKIRFAVLGKTPAHHIHRQKPLETYFKEEAN